MIFFLLFGGECRQYRTYLLPVPRNDVTRRCYIHEHTDHDLAGGFEGCCFDGSIFIVGGEGLVPQTVCRGGSDCLLLFC